MSGEATEQETAPRNTGNRREWIEFVHFRLGDDSYMVELGRVTKMVRNPSVTHVPRAGPAIAGVTNLGGVIPVIVDGRSLFDLPSRPPTIDPVLLVLDRDAVQPTSVLVDAVVGIESHHVDHVEPPTSLDGWELPLGRRWFRAVVRVPNRSDQHTGVFDLDMIVSTARDES